MVYSLKSEEIERFISADVIDLMGLSDLPEDDKKAMRGKIIRTIENRALARIAGILKEKGKTAELEGIEEEEAILKFFNDNQIPYEDIFTEEALAYKAQLKTAAEMASVGIKPHAAEAKKEE
jgi:hypothetical protein